MCTVWICQESKFLLGNVQVYESSKKTPDSCMTENGYTGGRKWGGDMWFLWVFICFICASLAEILFTGIQAWYTVMLRLNAQGVY